MKKSPSSVLRSLGEQVRHLRKLRGISQEELALRADVDRTYISQIERGIGNPSILVLLRIGTVLKVSLTELFDF